MLFVKDNFFLLSTENNSYSFMVNNEGVVTHLHYGGYIPVPKDVNECKRALSEKVSHGKGTTIEYKKGNPLVMEDMLLEAGTLGVGDVRDPFIKVRFSDGTGSLDLVYDSYEILDNTPETKLPKALNPTGVLKLNLKDRYRPVTVELFYSVYEKDNVITRRTVIINTGTEKLTVLRAMSNQLDLPDSGYKVITFGGNWAREMEKHETIVSHGMFVNRTLCGVSSNRNNPFVMVGDKEITEDYGTGYGFNLVYSGNHYTSVDVSGFYKTRILQGIDDTMFTWILEPGEAFETPEAVMTYSCHGYSEISRNMHGFIRNHIIRGKFKDEPRPILLNSWEAAYFNIDEGKLLSLAKRAKDVGIELFVMDDGWFKGRNNDTSSLGDWTVDYKKLPNGVKGLSDKIHALGLKFGIWVEPEMINEDSDLYREHKEYAMEIPGKEQSLGRNQMILDLTQNEVKEYVINAISSVIDNNGVDYVKWDMNRYFSDVYSKELPYEKQGETLHRYIISLYEILETLMEKFPDVLFEGCASGGNRFDLGMLCYFPQIWGSDDTDAIMRTMIQTGYSYGYPMSTVTSHVSSCPNHQTLRTTPLYTRFNVASFGVLGYEMNLNECTKEEIDEIKKEISLYKAYRDVFFYGDFYRVSEKQWMVVSPDKKRAVTMIWNELVNPNEFFVNLRTKGLDEEKCYHIYNIPMKINVKEFGDLINQIAPIHVKKNSLVHEVIAKIVKLDSETEDYVVSGALLNNAGLKLTQAFGGTGYNNETRLFQDFQSRMYFIEEAD